MWVLFAADDDGVHGDEDSEHQRQNALNGDQYHAGDRLGRLRDAKLLDEDQDAHYRVRGLLG